MVEIVSRKNDFYGNKVSIGVRKSSTAKNMTEKLSGKDLYIICQLILSEFDNVKTLE